MKKTTLLNRDLSMAVAGMGHHDLMLVADAGCPIALQTVRIDLAVRAGLPREVDVLEVILSELSVEGYIVSAPMREKNPSMREALERLLPGVPATEMDYEEFRSLIPTVKYAVRTGEYTPYSNVILVGGAAGIE
jgi:D-ribose pyranase